MSPVTVTTQDELDAALTAGAETIYIQSDAGVWLSLDSRGSSHVVAWGSSHVVAWGSSHVEARGSSHVVAWDSSHVVARGSSHVEARGSSHVEAWGSSHVVAWGSSHVVAWGSSHVEAGAYVAVHLYSTRVTLTGGVVIDLTTLDLTDRTTWLDYRGVKVTDGRATLYKAVDQDLNAGHDHTLTAYPLGATVTAPDWQADGSCGHGLHFGVTPAHAKTYYIGASTPRFLEVTVDAETLVPLRDKAKAPSCVVVREVTLWGEPVEGAS